MKKDKSAYLIGILTGAIISFSTIFALQQIEVEKVRFYLIALSMAILSVAIIFAVLYLMRDRIFKKLFGATASGIDHLVDKTEAVVDGIFSGERRKVQGAVSDLTKSLLASFSWISLRSWVISVFVGLSAIYVGGVGTILLLEQNARISTQNEIMEAQRRYDYLSFLLKEADRRSALYPLLVQQIDSIMSWGYEDLTSNEDPFDVIVPPYSTVPPREDLARLGGLASSLQPYWHYDSHGKNAADALSFDALEVDFSQFSEASDYGVIFSSPERGLLAQTLLSRAFSIDEGLFSYNYSAGASASSTFAYSDLRGLSIQPALTKKMFEDFEQLSWPQDLFLCAYKQDNELLERDGYSSSDISLFFPALDHKFSQSSILSEASFKNVHLLVGPTWTMDETVLLESRVSLVDKAAIDQLSSTWTEGVEFSVSWELLGEIGDLLRFGSGISGVECVEGGNCSEPALETHRHKGNCAIVSLNDVNRGSESEFGFSRSQIVNTTYDYLATTLGVSVEDARSVFQVLVSKDLSGLSPNSAVGDWNSVVIRRRDIGFG